MAVDGFRRLSLRLIEHVKGVIQRGELTERRVAKLMGYSQPHVHNVLAGVRGMNLQFGDDLLSALGISLAELRANPQGAPMREHMRVTLCAGALSPSRSFPKESTTTSAVFVPSDALAEASAPLALRVGDDEHSMWPQIWPGDVVVIDASPACRIDPNIDAIYVLRVGGRGQLRRCRRVGSRLLTIADYESEAEEALTWVGLDRKKIFEVVRGRVVWISRAIAATAA